MLGVPTATALVIVCAAILGRAIWAVCGLTRASTAAPAAGLALLLALAEVAIRAPGHATTASIVVAVVLLAALAAAARQVKPSAWPLLTTVLAVLLAMVPFASSGRFGLLGVGTNDDMAEHLLAAFSLQGAHPAVFSKIVHSGYPIGPHALAATITHVTGISLEHAFTGLIVAVPALLALAAAALLTAPRPDGAQSGPGALVAVAGVAVGLCYLQSAFLVQSSFKEPLETLFLVAFAAVLVALPAGRGRLRAVPLGILAAGAIYVYSYPGLAWLGGTLLLWGLAQRTLRPRGQRREQALERATLGLAIAAFAILIAPEIPRMIEFAGSGYNRETPSVFGNLMRTLSPLQALGIWPRLDFRFALSTGSPAGIAGVVALVALVLCLVRQVRRHELMLPLTFAVCGVLYAANAARSPYSAAKALTILAATVTLVLARETLHLLQSGPPRRRPRLAAGSLLAAVLVMLLAWGGYSDLEVLRDAPVGPSSHADDLARLRPLIGRAPTLFLGADDFAHWELRRTDVATPPQPLYATTVVPLRRSRAHQDPRLARGRGRLTTLNRFAGVGLAFDFDSVPVRWLDRFTYAILPRSGYQSAPPPNWRPVLSSGSYELWRRSGPTTPYATLTEVDNPGAILDCTTPAGRALTQRRGVAMVRPAPVIGPVTDWHGAVGYAGRSAHQTLRLAPGAWAISLQYAAAVAITVTAPGLNAVLPASLEPRGPYWFAGVARVRHGGPVRVTVSYHRLPPVGRLLGAFGLTRAPTPTGIRALGRVVASRFPVRDRSVPLRRACGRYVDRYRTS